MKTVLDVLKALLSSKRFVALLITGIVLATNKIGLDLDPDTIQQLVYAVVAYLGGQSISDTWGKGAIQAKAKALNDTVRAATPDPS